MKKRDEKEPFALSFPWAGGRRAAGVAQDRPRPGPNAALSKRLAGTLSRRHGDQNQLRRDAPAETLRSNSLLRGQGLFAVGRITPSVPPAFSGAFGDVWRLSFFRLYFACRLGHSYRSQDDGP